MNKRILLGTMLVLGLMVVLSVVAVSEVQASVIDFESAIGDDNDDFVSTNPMFGGLNWSQNGDLPNKSRWEIDTDNNPFASLPAASLSDATKWVQGFAEGVSTPGGGAGDPNRAKFGWDEPNSFTFNSLWIRTRFVSDALGAIDTANGGDGIDDRWLTSIELVFRDVYNVESLVTIDLTLPSDPSGWVQLTATDVTGDADLTNLKAVFFYGDSGTTVPGVRNDRFAVDNLDVTFQKANQPPTADAGGPYLVAVDDTIPIDGYGFDPDEDALTCLWTAAAGSLDDETAEDPDYIAWGEAGIVDLTLTVTDPGLLSDSDTTMVVVYDPDGGFVTGGGWIDSPEEAYVPDPSLAGKANFGFVSKYKKSATVPTGQTEFQFHMADLNFHSSSYDWLVVTGSNYAKFKGAGTINGEGDYKFKIWAGDSEPDTFRIKIWEEDDFDNEMVEYDNGFDQAIGGGSIVIHTKK